MGKKTGKCIVKRIVKKFLLTLGKAIQCTYSVVVSVPLETSTENALPWLSSVFYGIHLE